MSSSTSTFRNFHKRLRLPRLELAAAVLMRLAGGFAHNLDAGRDARTLVEQPEA